MLPHPSASAALRPHLLAFAHLRQKTNPARAPGILRQDQRLKAAVCSVGLGNILEVAEASATPSGLGLEARQKSPMTNLPPRRWQKRNPSRVLVPLLKMRIVQSRL